ncbi:putative alcohol dehydrogenase [Corchorus capsularis]|uniref:Putative alcohol dehydrogenase n=1 Tax=Corchorus capsularis TaxID=210143 RepID=A0A1R3IAH1_COCAP|nr:putative alcohol dehydrogenase [Corchorus capsularis]
MVPPTDNFESKIKRSKRQGQVSNANESQGLTTTTTNLTASATSSECGASSSHRLVGCHFPIPLFFSVWDLATVFFHSEVDEIQSSVKYMQSGLQPHLLVTWIDKDELWPKNNALFPKLSTLFHTPLAISNSNTRNPVVP